MKLKDLDYKKASKSLMKWAKSKITNYEVENFTSSWTDGIALCQLVNSIRADSIPESMFNDIKNPEMNVRLACTTAEDELGIPELIAPYDIANGKVEEKSMMTYIALFRSADRMIKRGIKTRTYTSDVSITSESESEPSLDSKNLLKQRKTHGIPYQIPRCVAFGSGLRWGQVGKPAEFIVRLNGAQASDLSVSIECRPYDHRAALYKPELQIKPIAETTYIVRYTPTRPGEYVLSIFCAGDHIPNSPFRLSVQETVLMAKNNRCEDITIQLDTNKTLLTTELLTESIESTCSVDSKHDSAFVDDDFLSSGEERSPPPWLEKESHDLYKKISKYISPENYQVTAFGGGLRNGQVGNVGCFHVQTPNTDKGPLSVTITCPAMSIPVPCVKTKLQRMCLLHDVLYLPTEPGVYEIHVQWGEKAIPDSPFRLCISESETIENSEDFESIENKLKAYRDSSKHTFYLYYSASTRNVIEHHYKENLRKVLLHESAHDSLITVAVDIELTSIERKSLFKKSNGCPLPFVFSGDKFIGSYNDVMGLYSKESIVNGIKEKVTTFTRNLSRLSSSSNSEV